MSATAEQITAFVSAVLAGLALLVGGVVASVLNWHKSDVKSLHKLISEEKAERIAAEKAHEGRLEVYERKIDALEVKIAQKDAIIVSLQGKVRELQNELDKLNGRAPRNGGQTGTLGH